MAMQTKQQKIRIDKIAAKGNTSDDKMDFRLDSGSSQKLTEWTKEPSVQDLKQDWELSKSAHDIQVSKINRWNDLLHVRGQAAVPKVKGRSSVQPKLIRRQAEWRYSALSEPFLSSSKLFNVTPTTFEDATAADQNELLLNWQFRTKINRIKFIDDLIRSTVDEGTCIVQTGWERQTVKIKVKVPVWTHYAIDDEEKLQAFQQALELKQSDPRTFDEKVDPALKSCVEYYEETGEATYAEQTGTDEVEQEKILVNKPTYEIRNPKNVFIDPSCNGEIDKANFICISFETSKSELLKKPNRYKNLNRINWEANTPLAQPDHETNTPSDFQFRDALRKKVVAYEYWGYYDIEGNGKLTSIVATWIGDVLIRMELNPFPDGKLPFVVIPYLPVKREIYGEPDAELLEDNQKIQGALIRGMIDLLGRSANAQHGFAKGTLDVLNRRRYDNGQDYEFNPGSNINQMMIEHKYPELPQSALLMLNLQNQEAEALTGVKSFSGGVSGDSFGDVAAGVRGALDAASKREMAILRRIAKGLVELGVKTVAMNSVFLSKEEVVRVTNREFVTIKRDDIQGNFDLEVDISTAEVDNAKSQDLAFMLQTIGPKGDVGMVMMILAEIADLKRMPDLAEKLRKYQPQVSPEQQELMKLEVELKRKEVEKLQSEIELNQAKAEEAKSNKDMKDLDYVETETGTKHARDLEKQQAQARGNQNLAVTKAIVTPKKEGEAEPDIEAGIGFNELSEKLGKLDPVAEPALAQQPFQEAPVDFA